jgi:glycosyltransferase involved in cell wall biosynthesis
MSLYIQKDLFPVTYTGRLRMNIKDFDPCFPDAYSKKPLIVHAPTAKVAKGTNYIIPVIEKLQLIYDFEFQLLHNLSRNDVLGTMKKCDVFIDQLILGSHGTAALEAMAFGKPVMCYLMPAVFEAGLPIDCPIINTNPENLEQQLVKLLVDAELRNSIGRKSREYVENYHDAEKLAEELLRVYTGELKK